MFGRRDEFRLAPTASMRGVVHPPRWPSMLVWDGGAQQAANGSPPDIGEVTAAKSLSRPGPFGGPRAGQSPRRDYSEYAAKLSPRYNVQPPVQRRCPARQRSLADVALNRFGGRRHDAPSNGGIAINATTDAKERRYRWRVYSDPAAAREEPLPVWSPAPAGHRPPQLCLHGPAPTLVDDEPCIYTSRSEEKFSQPAPLAVNTLQLPRFNVQRQNTLIAFFTARQSANDLEAKTDRTRDALAEAHMVRRTAVLNLSMPPAVPCPPGPQNPLTDQPHAGRQGPVASPRRQCSGVKLSRSGRPFLGRFKRLEVFGEKHGRRPADGKNCASIPKHDAAMSVDEPCARLRSTNIAWPTKTPRKVNELDAGGFNLSEGAQKSVDTGSDTLTARSSLADGVNHRHQMLSRARRQLAADHDRVAGGRKAEEGRASGPGAAQADGHRVGQRAE